VAASEVPERLIRVFLSELSERLTAFDADLVALENPPSDDARADVITRLFRGAHSLKGAAASIGASPLEMECQRLEDVLAGLRDGSIELDNAQVAQLYSARNALRDAARTLQPAAPDPPPAPAEPAASVAAKPKVRRFTARAPLSDPTLRVSAQTIDALLEQSGELLVAHHRTNDVYRALVDADETVQRLRTARPSDELRDLHRALERIAASMQTERTMLETASAQLDRDIRALRLVPFGDACEGLERVVRDAAEETGKRVRLEIAGDDLGVDRMTLERLRDPLVALVRNAIDHGIELPDERVRLGKPAEGTIRLRARPKARNFELTVSDDGRGLDMERLRRRLRERGLAGETDEDLARAVFLPGVSTAAIVTHLSGRGVGLDVVRTEVEALGGTAEVSQTDAGGTTFLLSLPLTITTLRVIVVEDAGQTFGISVAAVDRVERITEGNVAFAEGRSVLLTGGAAMPLVPLHAVLGIPAPAKPVPRRTALILGLRNHFVAISVDALLDEREVHLRSLGPRLNALPHIAGAALGGDGAIALILRSSIVIESALRTAQTLRNAPVEAPAPAPPKRVLLVDDSVTTRTLERSILEAAGYAVITAADGRDAWTQLSDESIDLVVSDVDMPIMDGIALVEAIRASTALRELPVILVTARESERDRQRGLEAGADAYIVKSSFRQEELLDAIGALA
jgi:two-component system, chemotaxis family, sensor kinase CheA